MKAITLNTWGGRGGIDELLAFFATHADTDVFCLQEIWHGAEDFVGRIGGGVPLVGVTTDLLERIAYVLPNHTPYFRPCLRDSYGMAMFIRTDHTVRTEGESYIYKEKGFYLENDIGDHARILQYVTLDTPHGIRTILHFHGLWQRMSEEEIQRSGGKADNADRLIQSQRVIDFISTLGHPFVVMGDFNLLPETKSMQMLEAQGLRNLITEYGVTNTRTHFYTKPGKFADYVLVSEGIDVNDFKVLPDEISDHAPLLVEFS